MCVCRGGGVCERDRERGGCVRENKEREGLLVCDKEKKKEKKGVSV